MSQARYFDTEFAVYGERYCAGELEAQLRPSASSPLCDSARAGAVSRCRGRWVRATVIEVARLGVDVHGLRSVRRGRRPRQRHARAEGASAHARFVACMAESLPFVRRQLRLCERRCGSRAPRGRRGRDAGACPRGATRAAASGSRCRSLIDTCCRHSGRCISGTTGGWGTYAITTRLRLIAIGEQAGFRHVATSYTGHAVKIAQLVLDRLLPVAETRRSSLWWRLERLDLRAERRPWGALQLNVLLART